MDADCDCQSDVQLAKDMSVPEKHIDVGFHFIREKRVM